MTRVAALALYATFLIHVPDTLISQGADWYHYNKEPQSQSKPEFVLENTQRQFGWIIDSFITAITFGKVRGLHNSGITIEVVE